MRGALMAAAVGVLVAMLAGCPSGRPDGQVVVYTSVDQVYADRLFRAFTNETGVRVLPVYDTEAGKTTGLYQRLLAERHHPTADVFWNNEICRTIQLADEGIGADLSGLVPDDLPRRWVDSAGRWAAFSLRARVIVYNTNLLDAANAPQSVLEFTDPKWRGKLAMANPLFGTTATHAAALYETLGEARAEAFFKDLKANDTRIVEGNSVVRDLVARGDVWAGLTDTDDVFSGMDEGMPIAQVVPDREGMGTLVIPNSVLLIAGGPHPTTGRQFARWILSAEAERLLAFERARQVPVRAAVDRPEVLKTLCDGARQMDVDYRAVAGRMTEVARRMEMIFLR